jgi:RNA polymerase sigma-70 factor (ECF subfamily)
MADSPEDLVLRRERLDRLRAMVSRLDANKRELLALRFAAGLTSREIGTVVGKSEGAVKKQLFRIIASLKEQYVEEPD